MNVEPFTLEEVKERIAAGTYKFREPRCVALNWIPADPVSECLYENEFPVGYPISDVRLTVLSWRGRTLVLSEIDRVQRQGALVVHHEFDRWRIRFHLKEPVQGYAYRIDYSPPSESELKGGIKMHKTRSARV